MSTRYPEKYIIGLTGNIAVGKSLVMQLLNELGAATIDADRVAHGVMLKGGGAYDAVVAAFGESILDADGEIARAALGKIVFADPVKLRQLESISHPAVRRQIDSMIRAAAEDVIVIEAIKLLEGDLQNAVDAVWVVNAAPAAQLARLITERGLSESEATQRIALQNSQADKLRQADVIIENDGQLAETRAQVRQHWAAIGRESAP